MSRHDTDPTRARPGSRRIACADCGTAFGCSNRPGERCWCGTEAFRLPLPLPDGFTTAGDCLCPTCLRALAERLREAGLGPDRAHSIETSKHGSTP